MINMNDLIMCEGGAKRFYLAEGLVWLTNCPRWTILEMVFSRMYCHKEASCTSG